MAVDYRQRRREVQGEGTGTINSEGEYNFMIWAGDGDPDTFRIKIWTEDAFGFETIVYDNGSGELQIGGGQIMIHTVSGKNN